MSFAPTAAVAFRPNPDRLDPRPAPPGARLEVSFEIFPPKSAEQEAKLFEALTRLASLRPSFISVTCGAGGSGAWERTFSLIRRMQDVLPVETAAHLTCASAPRVAIEALARDYWDLGVRRIVALRGDVVGGGPYQPHPDGYAYAVDLVAGLRRIADFDISVAAYPETHPAAPSPEFDLDNLKRKLEAGAERAITQYFFDVELFLRFRDRVAARGITAPVVPGILPVRNFTQVQRFSAACGASVPLWLAELFDGLDDDPETRRLVGMGVAFDQVRRLQAEGASAFHFYTLNQHDMTFALCRMLGLRPQEAMVPAALTA